MRNLIKIYPIMVGNHAMNGRTRLSAAPDSGLQGGSLDAGILRGLSRNNDVSSFEVAALQALFFRISSVFLSRVAVTRERGDHVVRC